MFLKLKNLFATNNKKSKEKSNEAKTIEKNVREFPCGIARYNINKMVSLKSDSSCFLPNEEQKIFIQEDINILNSFLKQASILSEKFPDQQIKKARFTDENHKDNGMRDYTCFFHNPSTPTGKPAKYPLKMFFATRKNDPDARNDFLKSDGAWAEPKPYDDIFGTIEYLPDNSIGKFLITCWVSSKCYTIHGIKKGDILEISKLETTGKDGLLEILYKK